MSDFLLTAPAAEPISLSEAKLHLKIDSDTTDDNLITALIVAARQAVEKHTRRALITQTWQRFCDFFPLGQPFILPFPRLQSVTHIKYYDQAGALQTLSAAEYQVDVKSEPGRVYTAVSSTWPSIENGKINAVEIQFIAGYGNAGTDVPQAIRQAILLLVAHWYEQRGAVNAGSAISEMPIAVDYILSPYRDLRFF